MVENIRKFYLSRDTNKMQSIFKTDQRNWKKFSRVLEKGRLQLTTADACLNPGLISKLKIPFDASKNMKPIRTTIIADGMFCEVDEEEKSQFISQ